MLTKWFNKDLSLLWYSVCTVWLHEGVANENDSKSNRSFIKSGIYKSCSRCGNRATLRILFRHLFTSMRYVYPRHLGRLMTRVLTMERQRAAPRSKRRKRTTGSWELPNILMPNVVGNCFCAPLLDCHTNTDIDHRKIKHIKKLRSAAAHLQLSHQGIVLLAKEVLSRGKINVRIPCDNYLKQKFRTAGGHYIANQNSSLYVKGEILNISRRFAVFDPPETEQFNDWMTPDKVQLSICQHFGTESQTLQRAQGFCHHIGLSKFSENMWQLPT